VHLLSQRLAKVWSSKARSGTTTEGLIGKAYNDPFHCANNATGQGFTSRRNSVAGHSGSVACAYSTKFTLTWHGVGGCAADSFYVEPDTQNQKLLQIALENIISVDHMV